MDKHTKPPSLTPLIGRFKCGQDSCSNYIMRPDLTDIFQPSDIWTYKFGAGVDFQRTRYIHSQLLKCGTFYKKNIFIFLHYFTGSNRKFNGKVPIMWRRLQPHYLPSPTANILKFSLITTHHSFLKLENIFIWHSIAFFLYPERINLKQTPPTRVVPDWLTPVFPLVFLVYFRVL